MGTSQQTNETTAETPIPAVVQKLIEALVATIAMLLQITKAEAEQMVQRGLRA